MSQTESLLLVALGFALALVLAMIFGFAIWSSANRWASYKRKREVPTTILDMQAEREALRAQNAMATRRLEFLLEEARAQAAEKTAQVTRQRNRAIVMSKDLIAKDAEIASLRALAAELTNETNKRARIIAKITGHEAVKLRNFDLPVPAGAKAATRPAFDVNLPTPMPVPADIAADAAPLDRIKAKIAELNALSAQIAGQQSGDVTPAEASAAPAPGTAPPAPRAADPVPLALAALREGAAEDEKVIAVSSEGVAAVSDAAANGAAAPDTPATDATSADASGGEAAPPPTPEKRMTLAEKFRSLKEGVRN
ncbi:hypothetical protein [Aestuariivirga sp.]|uniref:hypothetical protein n=1 Tax=Aestuariivirga sp. TaxID=2650926 RepID=UPI0039E25770